MRYTVLGFNQEALIKYDLNMNEVLLLDYIYNAVASPTMIHKIDNDISYVWLNHKKVLEDLPILNIGEDRLKRILQHLLELHLIQSIREIHGKGSRSYYCITKECQELRYSTHEVLKTTLHNDVRSVENNTSYNKLNNDNKLNSNNSKELLLADADEPFLGSVNKTKEKPKKKNLYQKCVDMINDFTDNPQFKDLLTTYLKYRLEIRDKPMYANMWKGMLRSLDGLCGDDDDLGCEIVQQSINRGYLGFYAVNKRSSTPTFDHTKHVEYGEDYDQKQSEWLEEMKKDGKRTEF